MASATAVVVVGLVLAIIIFTSAGAAATTSAVVVTGGVLDFSAADATNNNVLVSLSGSTYTVTDSGSTLVAGSGCTNVTSSQVTCSSVGVTSVHIDGRDASDTLRTTAATNTVLDGGDGDDTLTTAGGADALNGGIGNDTLSPSTGNDVVTGGADNDTVDYTGNAAAVTINLATAVAQNTIGAGSDTITTTENATGTALNDTLIGDGNANVLTGAAGNDVLTGAVGSDTVSYATATAAVTVKLATTSSQNTVGAGSDTITTTENVAGSAFNDSLTGDGNANILTGSFGNDVLTGGVGTDTVSYATATAAVTVSLATAGSQNTIGAGSDTLATVESLTGSAFADTLSGSTAANTIAGGAGNDTLDGNTGADILQGGTNTDTVSYASRTAAVTATIDGSANDGVASEADNIATDVENLIGGTVADTLTGSSAANTITGGAGNDVLNGGTGTDSLIGSAGTDTATYSTRTNAVTATLDGVGNDGETGENDTIATDVENLTGGSGGDNLTGNSAANTLTGNNGNDTLDGNTGADSMVGSGGTDTVTYASRTAAVTATIDGTANDGVASEADNIATDVENVTGGSGNDTLTGSTGVNALTGNDGYDLLDGNTGADSLVGNSGNDKVTYASRSTAVTATIDGVANDGVAGEADNIATDVEDLIGGTAADTLTGNSLDNTITGGAGNDTLNGGAGDDFFAAGSVSEGNDVINGGTESDTIDYSARTATVTVTIDGTANDGASGETDNVKTDVENVNGSSAADTITGSATANRIAGGQGNDVLAGGAGNDFFLSGLTVDGNDTLNGGTETDTADYSVRAVGLTITIDGSANDGASGETDNVKTDVENVNGGSANDSLTGSSSANVLTGGSGTDTVSGAAGADTILIRDQFADTANCGSESDFVSADVSDTVNADCELIDRPQPASITSGPANGETIATSTAIFGFTSQAPATFECKIDSGSFAACTSLFTTPVLADASHTFSVKAIDAFGNVDPTPVTRTFVIDTTAPDTSIDSGPTAGGTIASTTPSLTFSSPDGTATFECKTETTSYVSCSSPWTTPTLSDVLTTVNIRAKDPVGNLDVTPATRTFTVDATAPETSIDSGPVEGSTITSSTADFAFSSEANATFECKVDSDSFSSCTSVFTTALLADGGHSFSVRASDAVGNTDQTPATRSFTIDATAPETAIDSGPADGSTGINTTPTFSFSSEPSAIFQCKLDGGVFAPCTSSYSTPVLSDGQHVFYVRAIDAAGNIDQTPATRTFTVDATPPDPPTLTTTPPSPSGEADATFEFTGELGAQFECQIDGASFESCSSPKTYSGLTNGTHIFGVRQSDAAGNVSQIADSAWLVAVSNDPPPINPTQISTIADETSFIYTGPNSMQQDVVPGTIEPQRVSILRGTVRDVNNQPVGDVALSINDHPEYGSTRTDGEGKYFMAVNGGGTVDARFEKDGYLAVDRNVKSGWMEYTDVDEVVMSQIDDTADNVDLTLPIGPTQVAQGEMVTDTSGSRQQSLLFEPGTVAEMQLPDGSTQTISDLHVRATEFTVGQNGPDAMPAPLPPNSAYTYAAEFTIDEAEIAGADSVEFSKPVIAYQQNFLDFPVGTGIPSGYYDREKDAWIASDSGLVVKILSIVSGEAVLALDASNQPATQPELDALGVDDGELVRLGSMYPAGQTLWRVPIAHFSPWDFNMGFGLADGDTGEGGDPTDGKSKCSKAEKSGSIIECENQTLGERVGIPGTKYTLNYRSDRVPDRVSDYTIDIPITDNEVSPRLLGVDLEVLVAGRKFIESFPPDPNQTYRFTWDGMDAFGRKLVGAQPITTRVGARYAPSYQQTPRFASYSPGATISTTPARDSVSRWQENSLDIGPWDARSVGLGGWTLDGHDTYSPGGRTLYTGSGSKRSSDDAANLVSTAYAGDPAEPTSLPPSSIYAEGVQATEHTLLVPTEMSSAPDGSVYIHDQQIGRVYRIDPEGVMRTVPGLGDGTAPLPSAVNVTDIAATSEGGLYVVDGGNRRIHYRSPDGTYTVIAGNGGLGPQEGPALENYPATDTPLLQVGNLAVADDGTIYFSNGYRISRVTPDGLISTVAGGHWGTSPDGTPAVEAGIAGVPEAITIGPDGLVYFNDGVRRIRRIEADGTLTTVAGNGTYAGGDGLPATQAGIGDVRAIAFGRDGGMNLLDVMNQVVRRVRPDGVIMTIAGGGPSRGAGGPSRKSRFYDARDLVSSPDGSIYVSDAAFSSQIGSQIRKLSAPLPGFGVDDVAIASSDGGALSRFDSRGRMLSRVNSKTGAVIESYAYDADGLLESITDGNGNVTTIEHDSEGQPAAIVGPLGTRTTLQTDAQGFLDQVTDAGGHSLSMTYTEGGLLESFTRPRGGSSAFTYDSDGRLLTDTSPGGLPQTLAREELASGTTVTHTSPMGRETAYELGRFDEAGQTGSSFNITNPDGTESTSQQKNDGSSQFTAPDGTLIERSSGPDARFGMESPLIQKFDVTTPAGNHLTASQTRTATLIDPSNKLSLQAQTETVTVNGRSSTTTSTKVNQFTIAPIPGLAQFGSQPDPSLKIASQSAANRVSQAEVDAQERPLRVQVPEQLPIGFSYDARGRIVGVAQGSRASAMSYDAQGNISTTTDALSRTTTYSYDATGQLTSTTTPDNRVTGFNYDNDGNLTSITPPSRPAHNFVFDLYGLPTSASAPDAGSGQPVTQFAYNSDHDLTQITRPDGSHINVGYDSAGRAETVTEPRGVTNLSYSPTTGKLTSISSAVDNQQLSLGYDGPLTTSLTQSGTVPGVASATYGDDLRPTSSSVNGDPVNYTYDFDGLITQVGAMSIGNDADSGQMTSTTLGDTSSSYSYSDYGELEQSDFLANTTSLLATQYTRDDLGRITVKTETTPIGTNTFAYTYGPADRLTQVTKNGITVASYTYDSNGNRLTHTDASNNVTASTYDAQDRLNTSGPNTYSYNENGEITGKTNSQTSDQTNYSYAASGSLIGADLPNGDEVTYVLDGTGRRVGKKINGNLTQGFLYGLEAQTPVAELDDQGNVTARFVYATNPYSPDYMVKGSQTYQLIKDDKGSVRLVVNSQTGTVVQELDYDEFGNVTTDTNPGFQPFGFAGGIWDRDTKLVHFGAREYDPVTGRFTTKDPIGFNGGDTNLYGYVLGDPVNFVDPSGLFMGLHFELPTLCQLGTRLTAFFDGFTLGATDKFRDAFGLQGGLNKSSTDYQVAHKIGRITIAVEAGVVSGAYLGGMLAAHGVRQLAVVIGAGGASGFVDSMVYYGGKPTAGQLVGGIGLGAFGAVLGDIARGSEAARTAAREAGVSAAASTSAGQALSGGGSGGSAACGC